MTKTKLYKEEDGTLSCFCPECGAYNNKIESDFDFHDKLPSGKPEYFIYCSNCGEKLLVSEDYDETR